jgi:hypothetical protein
LTGAIARRYRGRTNGLAPDMMPRSVLQLLDSAAGRPLQTWPIEDRQRITIGRADDNDIVLADPYVSRAHAYLHFDPLEGWRLVSISRQQVFFQGQRFGELALADGMVFRLGQNGCYLRFGEASNADDDRKTITFDASSMPVFALDQQMMLREVSEIVDGEYFQNLKLAAQQLRVQRQLDETKTA